MSNICIRL